MDKETLDKLSERLKEDFESFEENLKIDEESNQYPKTPGEIPFYRPRKLYTAVLFLDLRGFTSWLDGKTKMVSAVKVLYPYFRLVAEIIKKHEGSIEKFTGDGVMAVLGAPEGDVTACKSALECAIDIAAVLDHALNPFLAEKELDTIEWAMGIEYGLNYVTKAGAYNKDGKKYNLLNSVSKAANHASKLEGKAQANQILVGQGLYDKLPDNDDFKEELVYIGLLQETGKKAYVFKKRWPPEETEENKSEAASGIPSLLMNQKVPSVRSNGTILKERTENIPKGYKRYGE